MLYSNGRPNTLLYVGLWCEFNLFFQQLVNLYNKPRLRNKAKQRIQTQGKANGNRNKEFDGPAPSNQTWPSS